MTRQPDEPRGVAADPLLAACSVLLSEVGSAPMDAVRLEAALPLIRKMAAAIRQMDELDLGDTEPATVFRPLP